MKSSSSSLFADDLPEPRVQQFRMRRLQVHNWGTFNGLTDVPIAAKGFLFVGRSGSGKSTLLDAMSALLTPPNLVDFNAAAREAERTGRDRNLVSYVRGAWADQQDSASGEIATQYLRKGSTWTALVLEYRNGEGRVISLIRLFWIAGSGAAAADVRKHYMVAERSFDIASELVGFDLDLRKLKARLGDDIAHFDNFSGYAERLRHQLGIANEMALRLLHKTQSAKNLGDLNVFLRGFMLEAPKTFDASERLVGDFAELDGAHLAVVTARRQVETLLPARAHYEDLQSVQRQRGRLQELKLGLDPIASNAGLRCWMRACMHWTSTTRAWPARRANAALQWITTNNACPIWRPSAAARAASGSTRWNASSSRSRANLHAAATSVPRPNRSAASSSRLWPTTRMDLPSSPRRRAPRSRTGSGWPPNRTRRSASVSPASARTASALRRCAPRSRRSPAIPPTLLRRCRPCVHA